MLKRICKVKVHVIVSRVWTSIRRIKSKSKALNNRDWHLTVEF